jgi:hypothetical protein
MSASDDEREGIVKVGIEFSLLGSTSLLSASDTAGWTTAEWVSQQE